MQHITTSIIFDKWYGVLKPNIERTDCGPIQRVSCELHLQIWTRGHWITFLFFGERKYSCRLANTPAFANGRASPRLVVQSALELVAICKLQTIPEPCIFEVINIIPGRNQFNIGFQPHPQDAAIYIWQELVQEWTSFSDERLGITFLLLFLEFQKLKELRPQYPGPWVTCKMVEMFKTLNG